MNRPARPDPRLLLLLLLASLAWGSASQAKVYRCEIDGELVFSQIPCEEDAEEVIIRDQRGGLGADPEVTERMRRSTDRHLRRQAIERAIARTRRQTERQVSELRQAQADCRELPRTQPNPVEWQARVAECIAGYERDIRELEREAERRIGDLRANLDDR